MLLPRSGVGAKAGVRLRNTCGVIDSDYRGEWMAVISTDREPFRWAAGDRLLQMVLVPVGTPELQLVEELSETNRGEGGFGSTGE
ncbi:dUTP diphosphatase, partial [Staphylococcus aureus]